LLIASNRLPVTILKKKTGYSFSPSIGGLATGLKSFYGSRDSIWVGWAGEMDGQEDRDAIKLKLKNDLNCHPVFLSAHDVEKYYEGFSNKTIWPLFHYFPQYTVYDDTYYRAYVEVNRVFGEEIIRMARQDDIIWVHDYHLMLLPGILRDRLPDATIGFFLHIPFPSYELFRLLPWRRELLTGLLGADLIGFHTYDYARHFLSSVLHLLGLDHRMGEIVMDERLVKVDSVPMGIDYDRYAGAVGDAKVREEAAILKKRLPGRKIILSIDRLDYTKGIPQRLEAFELFLRDYPQWHEKVTLILVTAPSRASLHQYRLLKKEVDELVGNINGQYGTVGWVPIQYFSRVLSFTPLVAMYSVADVALITPLRDGMNLIAKEYIATKVDGKGVLIISEMAGAASELGEAVVVNPNNKAEMAAAVNEALAMTEEEQAARNKVMQNRLKRWNVEKWAERFVDRLLETKKRQAGLLAKRLSTEMRRRLVNDYAGARRRLILLDYDGTLAPFCNKPEEARPGTDLLRLLEKAGGTNRNEVVLVSGRVKDNLEDWFGKLGLGLIAEHGLWLREKDGRWEMLECLSGEWKEEIRPILELYADRTPGAFVEEKSCALVYHYRKAEPELGLTRARELMNNLVNLTSNLNLQVLEGNKVVEVKNIGINKGKAVSKWVTKENWGFILAVGDDWTDEDIFSILPETAYSIKVGLSHSQARFSLSSPQEVLSLLNELMETD
jgi:trehalose 6-phosphate synthase/phosphatase